MTTDLNVKETGINYLPTLYCRAKDGTIDYWQIGTADNVMITEYGKLNTTSPQVAKETIAEGKNIGKVNETSPAQQAESEAKSRWTKKTKKGYVESLEQAEKGEDDIKGIRPMLAHSYADHSKKIKWPAFVQPKLDGLRCVAIVEDGTVYLHTRKREQITSMPHIERELLRLIPSGKVVLDGELYSEKLALEKIESLVSKGQPDPEHCLVNFHVFDLVSCSASGAYPEIKPENKFSERFDRLYRIFGVVYTAVVRVVNTQLCMKPEDLEILYEDFLETKFEGAMVRNAAGPYTSSRSYDLQKRKQVEDAEFEVIAVREGRGKMAGKGILTCRVDDEREFDCVVKGSMSNREDLLRNPEKYIGRKVTVEFNGLTGANRVPRNPRALRFRGDVDLPEESEDA